MNNQGNFPSLNRGQMAGQNMQQAFGGGNTNNPLLSMFQNNLQGMSQQQRALFFENFQRNFQMMQLQQQSSCGIPQQQQGAVGNMNQELHNQMLQEFMRMQGNFQSQGIMGQSQGMMGSGNSQSQGMIGQSQVIMGSGNSQSQGMMAQSQVMMGSGISQSHGMMGQPTGMMGSASSQIMGMQPGISRQEGPQQGFIGNQNTINPHRMTQQSMGDQQMQRGQQNQLQRSSGSIYDLTNNQVIPQQFKTDKINVTQGVTENKNSVSSATNGQSLPISKSPFLNTTKNAEQASSSIEVKRPLNEPPRLKSILKSSSVAAKSAPISTSVNQTFNSVQEKAEKLREILKTYLYQDEEDKTSEKDSVKNQTGTVPGDKRQTVHNNSSSSKTSPFPARSLASYPKQVPNVTNSRTASSSKGQINPNSQVISSQAKPSASGQSVQQSKIEGHSILTLVSSGSRMQKDTTGKRKADLTSASQLVKKPKVTEIEDEDPEYVQAQVFISNIPRDTSKVMILDILRHYNFESPQVWMGRHSTHQDKICAFVKLPSLKDSKRVIAEMKGFPYKGKEMEIRFSAAADFIDYTVASDGTLQSQSSSISASNIGGITSVSSHLPLPHSAPPPDPRATAPAILQSVSGSAIPLETIPSYPSVVPSVESLTSYPASIMPPGGVVSSSALNHDVHTGYHGGPPPAQEIHTIYDSQYPNRLHVDRDIPLRKDTGSYNQEYRQPISPRNRPSHSPHYYPQQDQYGSPYRSSSRDRRLSPNFPSRGQHSSPGNSPHRRYSRSPDFRSSSNQRVYRRSRSRSPYSMHSRDHGFDPHRRSRSISPGYSAGNYDSEKFQVDDRYSMKDHESSLTFPDGRGQRSSLSPARGYPEPHYRGSSVDGSLRVSDDGDRHVSKIFMVHIENLPVDVTDSELQSLLKGYLYESVHLTMHNGKVTAHIKVSSSGEAKVIMYELNGHRFMGSNLQVEWSRESSSRVLEDRHSSTDIASGHTDLREKINSKRSRSFERERSKRSPERDSLKRSPERGMSQKTPNRYRPRRSPVRDRSRRSPDRDRSRRSSDKDRSRRSSDRDRSRRSSDRDSLNRSSDKERSRRSPERDRSRRSPERDRSRRSPGPGVGPGESPKKDWSKGTRKSLFQSYIDASYPNAPILGRKYIKEFTSEHCNSAHYLCVLCEVTLSWKEIADHMMGYKHRLKSIKRSHPKIYDKIISIENRVDMLGQCAKYALELENKNENIAWVETRQPEATAIQHLKKMLGDIKMEKDRREDKKDKDDRKNKEEDRKKKEEEKEEKSADTTSDIFKKIEAYKKKFEASKEDSKSEGTPAKRARTEDTKTTGLSFKDLSKQNKTLADTIEKGIASARKGADEQKNKPETPKKTTSTRRGTQNNSNKDMAKKSSPAEKVKNETKKVPQKMTESITGKRSTASGKEPELTKEVAEKSKSVIIKVTESKSNTDNTSNSNEKVSEEVKTIAVNTSKEESEEVEEIAVNTSKIGSEENKEIAENPKSVVKKVGESKNNTGTKLDEKVEEMAASENKVSAKDDVNIQKSEKTKSDVEKDKTLEKKGSEIENVKAKVDKEGTKVINDKANEIGDAAKEVNENNEELEEDLEIAPEDIEDLGKSISAELFGEELGDMEEEEMVEEKEEPAEVKEKEKEPRNFKGKMSNHRLSKIETYFELQRLKDPEGTGIVGLQYVVEGIPEKASKAHMYRCTLCNVKCLTSSIVHHIIGYKHRMKYFEVHHNDIFSTIVKMDHSRKVLSTECGKHAKAIEEKEGLKTVMSLSEEEFKQREKMMNMEQEESRRTEKTVTEAEKAAATYETAEMKAGKKAENKDEPVAATLKAKNKPETDKLPQVEQTIVKGQSKKQAKNPSNLAARIKEAKEAAKLVKFADGKETVELYKYIQHKPDVPLLGLSNITEIQGLYGTDSKSPTYLCNLCFSCTKIDGTQTIYDHLVSIKHMENYLKKHFPHKMIHLKLLSQSSAKTSYLHNQAKLLCQGQLKQPESIYVVSITQMEQDKAALKLAQEAAKAVEEAAEAEKQALEEAKQAAMSNMTEEIAQKVTGPGKLSASVSGPEVIDLTAEEEKYETPVALLYSKLAGLEEIPLVGLSYITEIQGICADKVPPRYQCKLCDDNFISANYINAHITSTDHRIRYLKANYPVFYSRAIGNKDETEKLCWEIEQQFGRESISVKKRILVRADGTVVYSDPTVVKAPVVIQTPKTEQHKDKDIDTAKKQAPDVEKKKQLVEGERQEGEIVFSKIIEGLDCTPMLGLQYIREVHHPTIRYPPVYECDVCNIKNGPYLKPKGILKHICSKAHRLNFIRENHFHIYTDLMNLSSEEQRKVAIDKHTKDIESKVGRGSITKVLSDKPVYWNKSTLETSTGLPENKYLESSPQEDENQTADEDQPHYKCKKCGMIVAKERRVGHIISVHVSCYKCKSCQLSFPSHLYLQKHMTLIHKSKQAAPNASLNHTFKMVKWFSWYSEKGDFFPTDVSGRLQLVCKECNRVVPLGQASEHYICEHVKGYQCKQCNAPHGSNVALEKHLLKRHNITETVPVVNYTADVQLSRKYIHVNSSKALEFIDLTDSDQSKPRIGIKKYVCNRCQTLFVDGSMAETHYKHCHFFEYPCSMCNYIFRVAVHLEKHYSSMHRVYRSVTTPVIPFELCYHVCLDNNKRMLLDTYLKEENISWKELSKTFQTKTAIDSASTKATYATNVVPETTTTTIPNQQSGHYVQNKACQSSESVEPQSNLRSIKYKDGAINIVEIVSRKEDPLFDWDTEHTKFKKRMEYGGIITCARKSKFMMNYTSTFSNYPLIGLQMMTEFQQKSISAEPWYMCELCQDIINWKAVTPHIVSLKHRILYLERNHPVLHDVLTQKQFDTIESLTSKVETLAQGVVKKEGKQFSMNVMMELPPSEKELKMLEEIKQGADTHLKSGLQPMSQINTGTVKDFPNSKTSVEANSAAEHSSSIVSMKQVGIKPSEEPKKKLPAWVKISKLPDKDSKSQDETDVSTTTIKEAKKDSKSKVENNKDSNKKQVSESRKKDEKSRSGRSKERRRSSRSRSRDRDRRGSGHSTRSRHDDSHLRNRRRRSAERDRSRESKDDHSRKRRRSRSKDSRDTKTSRTKSPKVGTTEETRTPKRIEKNAAANKPSSDKDKRNNKESAVEKQINEHEDVSKLSDNKYDNLAESENIPNVESLSLDELELISKSLQQQMEDDDLVDIEDIAEEIDTKEREVDAITEKETNVKISESKKVEGNTAPNPVVGKEIEDPSVDNPAKIEMVLPDQIVNDLVSKKISSKISDQSSENCVVDIFMISPKKASISENKVNQVYQPDEKSKEKMSMNSKEQETEQIYNIDNGKDVSGNHLSTLKTNEALGKTNTKALDSCKKVPETEDKVEKECDITIEINSTIENEKSENVKTEIENHREHLGERNHVSQTTEVNVDIVGNIEQSGDEMNIQTDTLGDTDGKTLTTDFDELIASQLGEDFVTVDDADENSPTEIKTGIPSLTSEGDFVPETLVTTDTTKVSVEIGRNDDKLKSSEKSKIGSNNESNENEFGLNISTDCFQSDISDKKSENASNLQMNIIDKKIEISEDIKFKSPEKLSINRSNKDTTKRAEKIGETGHHFSSVCLLEMYVEPSVSKSDTSKEADMSEAYDDSEDIEFMLDEEFETVDEAEDNVADIDTTMIDINIEGQQDKSDKSVTATKDKVCSFEKDTKKTTKNIPNTAQDTDQGEYEANAEKDNVKKKENVEKDSKGKPEITLPENVNVENKSDDSPVVITHFPMDDNDDDDIEEIFLGGDFITVDEHKEDEMAPAIDTAEDCFDVEFDPSDFVTVDEVDAGQSDILDQKGDKISTHSTDSTKEIASSKNVTNKDSDTNISKSREKTQSKDSDRSSKDKSDSKKSPSTRGSGRSHSSSRVKDKDQHSSIASTKEKRGRSNTSRRSTPEKSRRSSSRSSSQTSRTSETSAADKPRSGHRDNVTASVKTRSSDSYKVIGQVFDKQKIKEMAAVSRSLSRGGKERLGNYTVGQDGCPKHIDANSYLGIPIKHSTETFLNVKKAKTEGKQSIHTKSELTGVSKEGGDRCRQSSSRVSDSKPTDSKSSNEKSMPLDDKPGKRRESNSGKKSGKDGKEQCEISIEIG